MRKKPHLFRIFTLMIILFLLPWSAGAANEPPPVASSPTLQQGDHTLARVTFTSREELEDLTARLDVWEVHPEDSYLLAYLSPDDIQKLTEQGYSVEIDEKANAKHLTPAPEIPYQINGIPGYPCYKTVDELLAFGANMSTIYPNLAEWIDIGTTYEGRDLMVLRLTNENLPGEKAKLLILGGIHAREYVNSEMAARFADHLLGNYGADPDITWLLDYNEIHILLSSNPDGRIIAQQGLLKRKNMNATQCGSSTVDRGTDLNRNFSFHWNGPGVDPYPCGETYLGPSAASELETQAIEAYARSLFPDQRGPGISDPAPLTATGILIDLHSYGGDILWPWGDVYTPAPNASGLQTLGRKFAYFNGYNPRQSSFLYPTSGATDDFSYGELGVPGYTFEMGTSFFQDCSSFENQIRDVNLNALIFAAKAARRPYMEPAGPEAVDIMFTANTALPGETLTFSAVVDDTRTGNGEATQNISEAEYSIDGLPHNTPTFPASPADGSFNAKIETITGQVDTTGFSAGRHTLFVRAKDASGNWGVPTAQFFYIFDEAESGVITGEVRDGCTNGLLEARVDAGMYFGKSDPQTGVFSLRVPEGSHILTVSAPEYSLSVYENVNVTAGDEVIQNAYLYEPDTFYFSDFEAGVEDWEPQSPWGQTTALSHSPTHSWTDSPAGNYGNNRNVSLASPAFNFNEETGVEISFWHRYSFETGWDYGYLEYSTNGGMNWVTLKSYTGTLPAWTQEKFSLPTLQGVPNARFRFRLWTDSNTTMDGWYIDDFEIRVSGSSCANPIAPEAGFSAPGEALAGTEVQFVDLTMGTPPFSYRWDFGDGTDGSSEPSPVHIFTSGGVYTVTQTVTNTAGADAAIQTIKIEPTEPTLLSNVTWTGVPSGELLVGEVFTFTAAIEPIEATLPVTYTVDFGDGSDPLEGVITTSGGLAALEFAHAFPAAGTYTLAIQAWNEAMGTSVVTDTAEVAVVEAATALAAVTLTEASSGTYYPGALVEFTAGFEPLEATLPVTYTVDFGDGSDLLEGVIADPADLSELSFTHEYAQPGEYQVAISAWNERMLPGFVEDSLTVTIHDFIRLYVPLVARR